MGIHQLATSQFPDSMVWNLINHQKLPRVTKDATDFAKLLLHFLEMAFEEIILGHQELEAFIIQYKDCVVDSDTAASMQQSLQQTFEYLNDFESRITWNHCPLKVQIPLLPHAHYFNIPKPITLLIIKGPVIFDKSALRVTSNIVHLAWKVAGHQSEVQEGEFEIGVKTLDTGEEFRKFTCQSYNTQIVDLLPDTQYQFFVKRADDTRLVYGQWRDNIILKTDTSR